MRTAFEAEGDIRGVDLLAAFVAIWREGTSGSLRFSRGPAAAGFELAGGEIVGVSSAEPRFETAAILVRAGKLDAAALERLSVPPGTDAAIAALQAGVLTRREWKWGEKIRAIEVLADLLAWPDGKYVFDGDARPAAGEFSLAVPRLLLELFLRSRDRNLIDHQLGPTDAPLERSARFDEEFATFGLTADAESVVRLIDGQATALEISERAPAEEFAVLKLLAALKTLGLLHAAPSRQPETFSQGEGGEPSAVAMPPPFESWHATQAPESQEVPEPEASLGETVPQEPPTVSAGPSDEEELWRLPQPESEREVAAEETPAAWEEAPIGGDWEEEEAQLDQPLVTSPELPTTTPPARSGSRLLVVGVFLFLIAAVLATVLLRSRASTREPVALRQTLPTARPVAAVPSPLPAATQGVSSVLPISAATQPAQREHTPRPIAHTATTISPPPRREISGDQSRATWLARAGRDQRRLQSEKKARYAIQLELACEVPSLAEAWKHDQPPGSMWVLTASHGGKECFRVLWGRYGSLEEARRAKGRIPSFFVTPTNHPAVVLVR